MWNDDESSDYEGLFARSADENQNGIWGTTEIHRNPLGPDTQVEKNWYGQVTSVETSWFSS